MSKEEILDFVAQNIAQNSPKRRKLSIQVYGGQHLAEFKAAIGEEDGPISTPGDAPRAAAATFSCSSDLRYFTNH